MKKLILTIATMVITMCGAAHASLMTLGAPYWPPSGSSGLAGVQFNVVTGIVPGVGQNPPANAFVALGAHPYKNGATMPNDGISTFYGNLGTYPGEPNRANWSFDWAYSVGTCSTCSVLLEFDNDRSAAKNWVSFGETPAAPGSWASDSWNLQMAFLQALMGPFNANVPGSYGFRETIFDNMGGHRQVASTSITVNIPEPATILLLLAGFAGMIFFTKKNSSRTQLGSMMSAA